MKQSLIAGAVLASLCGGIAHAAPVEWTLDGWSFEDGGSALGSFVYDAGTNVFSQILVQTVGGGVPNNVFDSLDSGTATAFTFVSQDGFALLFSELSSALSDAGGTVQVSDYVQVDGDDFVVSEAASDSNALLLGTPVDQAPAPVPLPAALPLLVAGLGGLSLLRRRKA